MPLLPLLFEGRDVLPPFVTVLQCPCIGAILKIFHHTKCFAASLSALPPDKVVNLTSRNPMKVIINPCAPTFVILPKSLPLCLSHFLHMELIQKWQFSQLCWEIPGFDCLLTLFWFIYTIFYKKIIILPEPQFS